MGILAPGPAAHSPPATVTGGASASPGPSSGGAFVFFLFPELLLDTAKILKKQTNVFAQVTEKGNTRCPLGVGGACTGVGYLHAVDSRSGAV